MAFFSLFATRSNCITKISYQLFSNFTEIKVGITEKDMLELSLKG